MPAGLAMYASRGRWAVAAHLMLMNRLLLAVAARRIRRIMFFMPPRHGKSTMISLYFPAWYLGTFPDHSAILTSYESSYASTWGGRVRDLMNEYGPALWGLRAGRHGRRAADDWLLDSTVEGRAVMGGMRSAGIGSGLTGRGGDLIIIDDPIKDQEQAQSARFRQRAWDWYQSVLYTRKEPDAVEVLIMTRWHEDDLAGRLLDAGDEADDPWTVISLPAIAEGPDPMGRSVGEALWPERWPLESLIRARHNQDPYWWAALYQQRPAPIGGGMFQKRHWRFWRPADMDLRPVGLHIPGEGTLQIEPVPIPARLDAVAQHWDLTFDSASSYVVGHVWARAGADLFLMDEERGRWEFPGQVEAIERLSARWPAAQTKYLEDAANARAVAATLRRTVGGFILIPAQGDKQARAAPASLRIQSGNLYLPHPAIAPWVLDYIDELGAFPAAANDDRVITTAQAVRMMLPQTDPRGRISVGSRSSRTVR